MDKNGEMMQLNLNGPSGGLLVLLADYEKKKVSLIELLPTTIIVLAVQSYNPSGF